MKKHWRKIVYVLMIILFIAQLFWIDFFYKKGIEEGHRQNKYAHYADNYRIDEFDFYEDYFYGPNHLKLVGKDLYHDFQGNLRTVTLKFEIKAKE